MSTTAEPTWADLAPDERVRLRLDAAAVLDHCRAASGSSLDPARDAAYQRRKAPAELAETDEAPAITRGHLTPR